jgi:hypothetical protein
LLQKTGVIDLCGFAKTIFILNAVGRYGITKFAIKFNISSQTFAGANIKHRDVVDII